MARLTIARSTTSGLGVREWSGVWSGVWSDTLSLATLRCCSIVARNPIDTSVEWNGYHDELLAACSGSSAALADNWGYGTEIQRSKSEQTFQLLLLPPSAVIYCSIYVLFCSSLCSSSNSTITCSITAAFIHILSVLLLLLHTISFPRCLTLRVMFVVKTRRLDVRIVTD